MTAPSPGETIAAVATPPGRGGVGIVRVSGPAVPELAAALLGDCPPPRHAVLRPFRDADGEPLDLGLALYFPAPASFTGEAVLELHGHGGPVVLDRVLRRVLALGARLARPGEFSERAFVNGKLDLAQAEAIADLIASGSDAAARSAMRSLQGAFSARVEALVERLTALRTYVEAAIDFPDEEIDFLSDGHVALGLAELAGELDGVNRAAERGRRLHDGLNVVIAGPPNAGKSSLLNRFAGQESAIVTEVPGTTRDLLREYVQLDGLPLHMVDTAGLRDSDDVIEREGMRRAREAVAQADRVLLVLDDSASRTGDASDWRAKLPGNVPVTVVRNKVDLSGTAPGRAETPDGPEIRLSLKSGEGFGALREHLLEVSGYSGAEQGDFMARSRHLDALRRAGEAVVQARAQLAEHAAGELVAEELRLAQRALGEITGEVTSDALLGRIFAEFCIGK
ncbi:MAG: tRNA uridine-5-carboxymethylaminomethyl(34) synthesis GTPase MnmE [Gammaproteobacteria bacterium]|nr:tRNA uridine-5-carboxymethylaminomethyl(34) synthesis GTPase MnmE [Gammaproteobacteria bacterium]